MILERPARRRLRGKRTARGETAELANFSSSYWNQLIEINHGDGTCRQRWTKSSLAPATEINHLAEIFKC